MRKPAGFILAMVVLFVVGLLTEGSASAALLVGWGDNNFGQTNTPAGTFTAIAAGGQHSLALVPIPGTSLLLGTGLLSLAGYTRYRKTTLPIKLRRL